MKTNKLKLTVVIFYTHRGGTHLGMHEVGGELICAKIFRHYRNLSLYLCAIFFPSMHSQEVETLHPGTLTPSCMYTLNPLP